MCKIFVVEYVLTFLIMLVINSNYRIHIHCHTCGHMCAYEKRRDAEQSRHLCQTQTSEHGTINKLYLKGDSQRVTRAAAKGKNTRNGKCTETTLNRSEKKGKFCLLSHFSENRKEAGMARGSGCVSYTDLIFFS